ncbi:MAG: hypothetical protein FD124_3547, partial [Alphaproteobacteria bacterium]
MSDAFVCGRRPARIFNESGAFGAIAPG